MKVGIEQMDPKARSSSNFIGVKFIQALGLPTFGSENEDILDIIPTTKVSYWNGLYAIPAVFLGVTFSFIFTLIPYQNTLKFPSYWYEIAMLIPLIFVLFLVDAILQCYYCFKTDYMFSIRSFLRVGIPTGLMAVVPYLILLLIWTMVWNYNPPLPHSEAPQLLGVITFVSGLAMEIYAKNKKEGDVKRILWFVLQFPYLGPGLQITYTGLELLTNALPSQLQWIIAFLLPALREFHIMIVHKILMKARPCSNEIILFGVDMGIQSYHSFWVTLFLVKVTDVTVYLILGIEFLLHLYSCYQIFKIQKQITTSDGNDTEDRRKEMSESIAGLILGESLEVFVPFSYLITFFSAYYGPNAYILGNIRNSYWEFKAVDDVGAVVIVTLKMLGIDFGICVVTGLILWIFCRINFFQEFCKIMKTYWAWFALRIAAMLVRVN